MDDVDVVVVGAGLAGLTAARRLKADGYGVRVLEAGASSGGRMRSFRHDGESVDLGAAFIADFYPGVRAVLNELDLTDRLRPWPQRAAVVLDGETADIWPLNRLLSAGPLRPWSLVRLGLGVAATMLSRWRRLDPTDLTSAVRDDSESVRDWANRCLGVRSCDCFIEPLLRGLLYWDGKATSKAPLFVMLKAAVVNKGTYRLQGGMQSLCDAMSDGLDVRHDHRIGSVTAAASGWEVECSPSARARTVRARAVVLAVPADAALGLAPGLRDPVARFLERVTYSRTAVALVALPRRSHARPHVVFATSTRSSLASVSQHVFLGSRPAQYDLVRIYLSTEGYDRYAGLEDDQLGKTMLEEVQHHELAGYDWTDASVVTVERWAQALPEFGVGYLRRLTSIHRPEIGAPGLGLAGDYLSGPYMEGAVRSGLRAAAYVSEFLDGSSGRGARPAP